MKTYEHFTLKPITGAMGAEIFDIDLSQPLSDAAVAEIKSAWFENLVLILVLTQFG